MDFIERLLHISPDGGSGVFEAIILGVVVAAIVGMVLRRRAVKRRRELADRPHAEAHDARATVGQSGR